MTFSLERLAFPWWRYALAALIVILAGGYWFFMRSNSTPYQSIMVTQGSIIETVSVTGNTTPVKSVSLGFQNAGTIAQVYRNLGDHVNAGEVIAELNTAVLSAALQQARATYDSAVASRSSTSLPEAETKARNAYLSAYTTLDTLLQNDIDTFFGDPSIFGPQLLISAPNDYGQLSRERTALTYEMQAYQSALSRADSVDPMTLLANATQVAQDISDFLDKLAVLANDRVSNANATQIAALATARTGVTTLLATLSSARETYRTQSVGSTSLTDASVKQAAAGISVAEANLQGTRIVAPISGTITRMDAKVGEVVSPTDSLVTMQSNGTLQIETFVPEVSISRISVGNPATTTLDAYGSSVQFPAVVVAVGPAETMKDGVPTYKTTLVLLSPDPRIRSGMTANVIIETGVLHNAIVIPAGAVGMKNGGSYVSVVERGDTVNRSVTLGPSPALGQVHILSGLSAGDVVLLAPAP